ncbi:distal tail protein Dit [Heliorestis convoluta]|uniref:Phage tail protein n=1 Tax=Heliorestis convoluta TaxID=356322 RepID=A0A5Q2MXD4_9FIRM|nr:distal tail protein Dit [Heliorestis convoluta]QGG47354.1 phage tail protein [Heliorestis convoluta]
MLSFTFDGKESYKDFGLVIVKRPTLPSPKRRVHFMDIPGRHSAVRYDEKTYEDITVLVECALLARKNLVNRLDAIKGWLFAAGESDLIFSFQDDKKYRAQVVNAIDFTQVYRYASTFPILFHCRPFKYALVNNMITITASGQDVYNPGTVESEPVLTIFGQGNVTVTINGERIELFDVNGKIIVNAELKDCYDDALQNRNNQMAGNFPILKRGDNHITWTGNVQKIELLPNWRWL